MEIFAWWVLIIALVAFGCFAIIRGNLANRTRTEEGWYISVIWIGVVEAAVLIFGYTKLKQNGVEIVWITVITLILAIAFLVVGINLHINRHGGTIHRNRYRRRRRHLLKIRGTYTRRPPTVP